MTALRLAIALALALGLCTASTQLLGQTPSRTEFVELDVVALDHDDHAVRGLQARDFTVKEDGRAVTVTSFSEASLAGISGRDDARSIVLLLDDMVVPTGTTIIQGIATRFLNRARPFDRVDVVRLTRKNDELTGEPSVALERIEEYHGGVLGFFGRTPADDMLQTLSRVSRSLQSIPHRRKAIACIGIRSVCDPYLPVPEDTLIWRSWRDAISDAALANASLYIVDAAGVRSGIDLGYGVVDATGGEDFVRSNNFDRAADLIVEQASHYYLLGYTPTSKRRELHEIRVSIGRSGVRALARQNRGD